jgi:hypothetical protein
MDAGPKACIHFSLNMQDTCPTTPYAPKVSPFAKRATTPYAPKVSPFGPGEYCPFPFLLQENGARLMLENGNYIII